MFDHVTIRASNRGASERFYDLVLATLGIERTYPGDDYAEWDDFSLGQADDEKPFTRRLHIAFAAPSREHVHEFWRAGTAAGYRSDGEPGPRPEYSEQYYGSFLLDPDGNSAEAVHHGDIGNRGNVDHLWIRVADLDASTRFWETIAPVAGVSVKRVDREPPRTAIFAPTGSFAVVDDGEPTANVHLALPARDNATVDEFHRVAVGAGYRDNGAPGERRVYHEGYYGAFVLDPDGNNVELVNHNRP